MGAGAVSPEWALEGDVVDEATPELEFEGDAGGVGVAASESELEGAACDGAAPELGLEGGAGGVGGVAPESELTDDADVVDEAAPELGLEGDAGGIDAAGVKTRRRRVSSTEDKEGTTCSCANGKHCSSK